MTTMTKMKKRELETWVHVNRKTYNELYAQFLKGEITPEQWNEKVQKFFDELLELNKDVLVRLKNI